MRRHERDLYGSQAPKPEVFSAAEKNAVTHFPAGQNRLRVFETLPADVSPARLKAPDDAHGGIVFPKLNHARKAIGEYEVVRTHNLAILAAEDIILKT